MRVISKSRLKRFWETSGHEVAGGPLQAWYRHVNHKTVAWHSWADVKLAFSSASIVGSCIVFNIGGNKFRLVTRVLFVSQKVFVLKVMSHTEYDKGKWKVECGCFEAPPSPAKKPLSKPKKSKRMGE